MAKRNSTTTTHHSIAEYWFGRGICEDGSILDDVFAPDFSNALSVFSLHTLKPHCWACGAEYDGELLAAKDKTFFDCYDEASSKLNRCHILPKQFGGSDLPSNLFLMCENCHRESPDTRNKRAFFRWIYERRHLYTKGLRIGGIYLDVAKEMKALGFSMSDWQNAFAIAIKDKRECEVSALLQRAMNTAKQNMGQHGFYIAPATTSATAVDCLLEMLLQASLG